MEQTKKIIVSVRELKNMIKATKKVRVNKQDADATCGFFEISVSPTDKTLFSFVDSTEQYLQKVI